MVQDHLDLRAAREQDAVREQRAPATGADGITRNRAEAGHRRMLAALFGTVQVTRCAWRRPGAGNLYPADAALSLPAPRHSHTLARLAVQEAVRSSFETAHAAIAGRCGPVIGKRQVGQPVVNAAADIAAFYAARIPVPCTASALLVISADSKEIVTRPGAPRPATAKAARQGKMRTRLTAGEKPDRTRTATLACVYDAGPAPRRPHDVIAPPRGRHGSRNPRPRPRAKAKRLAGSVEHDPAMVPARRRGPRSRGPGGGQGPRDPGPGQRPGRRGDHRPGGRGRRRRPPFPRLPSPPASLLAPPLTWPHALAGPGGHGPAGTGPRVST
jgi:hypothetical protein